MQKMIYILLLSFFITSCTGFVDDSDEICVTNCTYFTGRVTDSRAIGIANVTLSLRFYGSFFGYERLVAKTTTDKDGYYTLNGDLKELRDDRVRAEKYDIEIDTASLNLALKGRNDVIKPSDLIHDGYFLIGSHIVELSSKDTTIQIPKFIVPSKSSIFITLTNFTPSDSTKSFFVTNKINYGFENNENNRRLSNLASHSAYATTSTFVVKAVVGLNIISARRWKNEGFWRNTVDSIYVESFPSNINLNYDF